MSSSSSSSAVAMEVLRLLGFMLDLWSRHRESLHQMMASSSLSEEKGFVPQDEAMMSVVERMEVELRDLQEGLEPSFGEDDQGMAGAEEMSSDLPLDIF